MKRRRFLLSEKPIMFHKTLAEKIGLNEAIILQQINYCQNIQSETQEELEHREWVCNSYKSWQEQLPFFSKNTIVRALDKLCKTGILDKCRFKKKFGDQTNWYSINYEKVDEICLQKEDE